MQIIISSCVLLFQTFFFFTYFNSIDLCRHAFATLSFIAETFLFLYVGMDALDIEKWKFTSDRYIYKYLWQIQIDLTSQHAWLLLPAYLTGMKIWLLLFYVCFSALQIQLELVRFCSLWFWLAEPLLFSLSHSYQTWQNEIQMKKSASENKYNFIYWICFCVLSIFYC